MNNHRFLKNTTLIKYSNTEFSKVTVQSLEKVDLTKENNSIKWLNTYGNTFYEDFKKIITLNTLDDFLLKLIKANEHSNKVIELEKLLFVTIKVLKTESDSFNTEQMIFILSPDFLWSIQEKRGDYFEWIRERLENKIGIARGKKTDYLLFLILESIIDNYEITFEKLSKFNDHLFVKDKIKATPEFTNLVESRKQELFNFKKATTGLRDIVVKLEKVQTMQIKNKYFSELKEQTINLISDTDFELKELESKINLIFSIQGHRLNEVMKTLTILSVIFIPLTFLAGIYGMNFENIPELKTKYGYFILLGIMLFISILIIRYFKKKKWF